MWINYLLYACFSGVLLGFGMFLYWVGKEHNSTDEDL